MHVASKPERRFPSWKDTGEVRQKYNADNPRVEIERLG